MPVNRGAVDIPPATPLNQLMFQLILRLSLLLATSWTALSSAEDNFTPLFNGRDLDGFYVVVKDRGIVSEQTHFAVENGEIRVYPSQTDGTAQPFASIVTTKTYQDYHLRFEYRWGTKKFAPRHNSVRDSGVLFHVVGPDVVWPTSVECQIQEGDTGDIWAVQTRVTSTVHPNAHNYAPAPAGKPQTRGDAPIKSQRFQRGFYYEQPGWNLVEVIVRGDHATFLVNGHIANEAIAMKQWDGATSTWVPLTSGKILFQAEGAELFYRRIEIKPLAPVGTP